LILLLKEKGINLMGELFFISVFVDPFSGKRIEKFFVEDERGQRGDDVPPQRDTCEHRTSDKPDIVLFQKC
jgi:hypothetical protein